MGREGWGEIGGVPSLWWPSESSGEPGSQNKAVEEMQREREGTETSFKALRKSGCAGRREDIAEEGEVG